MCWYVFISYFFAYRGFFDLNEYQALFRSICVGSETSITRDSAVLALKSLIPTHSESNLKLQELTIPTKVTEDVFVQLASTIL